MKLGNVLKQIRIDRGISQTFLIEEIMSQSSYSKFENGLIDISFQNYLLIAERLGIQSEELLFISQGYKRTKVQILIDRFFKLSHNNGKEIRLLKKDIDLYLSEEKNLLLEELTIICECLIIVDNNGDVNLLMDKIRPIWEKLSKSDEWYLSDLKILNLILYFFPLETAMELTRKAIKRLNSFEGYGDSKQLKNSLILNLSLLLIKDGNIMKASEILTFLLKEKRHLSYATLSVCYMRLAICFNRINNSKYIEYYDNSLQILSIYEDFQLQDALRKEFIKYTTI